MQEFLSFKEELYKNVGKRRKNPNIEKVSWAYHAYIDCVRRTHMFLTFGQVVDIGRHGKVCVGELEILVLGFVLCVDIDHKKINFDQVYVTQQALRLPPGLRNLDPGKLGP